MDEWYKETIQAIKDLDKTPLVKEWSTIAKIHGYMTPKTLSRIYGKNFDTLCKEIRKK